MRKYIPIYYLLCVLLILGAFAAMAQNAYGLTLLGVVAGLFALVFMHQLVTGVTRTEAHYEKWNTVELVSLILVCLILALRVFYIRFSFVEEVFVIAGLLLSVVYAVRLVHYHKFLVGQSKRAAWTVVLFHSSIALYVLSMVMAPLYPQLSEPLGILAFALLILFGVAGVLAGDRIIEGQNQSVFSFVYKFRDRSVVLVAIFLIFTGYMGLTKIGAVPKMYSDEYPQAYFELVNRSERGEDTRHEEFKEVYDRFVRRHIDSEKK